MIDLEQARAIATRPVEHSGDEQELRALIFDLCDELEQLRTLKAATYKVPCMPLAPVQLGGMTGRANMDIAMHT